MGSIEGLIKPIRKENALNTRFSIIILVKFV